MGAASTPPRTWISPRKPHARDTLQFHHGLLDTTGGSFMPAIQNHSPWIAGVLALTAILSVQGESRKYPDGLYAEVATQKGLIVLQLEFTKTPMTVANFVGLAEGTIHNAALPDGTPYFDGTRFHRVVAGHVIQTGIPAEGIAQGPGYQFPNEIRLPELNHGRAGMLNMANGGPHTNASQWCITLGDRSYLDGDYTVFGHVVQGMDVVYSIVQGDRIQSIRIARVGGEAEKFRPTTESFQKMVEAARERVRQDEEKRKIEEEDLIRSRWPQAKVSQDGVRYVVTREGKGKMPVTGDRLKVAYAGRYLDGTVDFVSTADGGRPYFGTQPEPFEYEVGRAQVQVCRGLDAALNGMTAGEKRVVIIPADTGYGRSGYYDKEKPGQKRFHISPNKTLVYEVEVLEVISR
jgi:cyclophilin family peptidyl-prolyl cis-trans isomerase